MTTTHAHDEHTRKVIDLIKGNGMPMRTMTAPDGTSNSRPTALQEDAFDGDL